MQNRHWARKNCVKNWKYCGIIAKPCEAMCRNIFHPPVSVSPAVGEGPPCLRSNKTCTNSQQMRSEKIIKHISRIKYNWCICGKSSQVADIQWAVDHMWYSQQFLPTIHTACTGLAPVSTIASSVEVKIPAHLHPRPPSAHQPTIFSAIHGPASSRSGPRPGFWVNSKIMQTSTPGPA